MNKNKLKLSGRITVLFLIMAMLLSFMPVYAESENDIVITVPNDATLSVYDSGNQFIRLESKTAVSNDVQDSGTSYHFNLDDGKKYVYRVSGDDYVTYSGVFTSTENLELNIPADKLRPTGKTPSTIDRNTSSNNGRNVADIYLNINPQGYLKLNSGDTYQIVSLRNWEIVENEITSSTDSIIEPDFHYDVIDENGQNSDILTVSPTGLITAQSSGTAIVLVTYDAITANFGSDQFFGAIYPENTGVFVVSVDSDESGIETGMTINKGKNNPDYKLSGDYIDSEHDCIYFTGDSGEYTFTPENENVNVSVANPIITDKISFSGFVSINKNDDNSFTVPLTTGKNIVKIDLDGKCEYQIINAKKLNVTVNNGENVHKGDKISVKLDTLYHPAQKLAGVYNRYATAIYTDVSSYKNEIIGASAGQYNFSDLNECLTISNVMKIGEVGWADNYVPDYDLVVPDDYEYDTFKLSGGTLFVNAYGNSYGAHRAISYTTGVPTYTNYDPRAAYLGTLPDIEIPIAVENFPLTSIDLNTDNVNKEYFVGDKFNTANLIVTANYENGESQIATNYEVSPSVMGIDTEYVTITYRGKSSQIPVTVKSPKVTSIEITTMPTKTSYTEGELFSPSGMVVTAKYENNTTSTTTNYTYSPNRELEKNDTEITITYTGSDDNITATVPITVNSKTSSSGSSSKITVYFTLLGDSKHGDGEVHTRKDNNLETWISRKSYSIDKNSTVDELIEKALSLNGIPYENKGNYITGIKGLYEFDNGNASGWLYLLNGKYSNYGVNEQTLKNGDEVILHYTDDYSVESDDKKSGGSSNSSKNNTTDTSDDKTTVTEPTEDVSDEVIDNTAKTFDYVDVSDNEWYTEAVSYVSEKNIMTGVDDNTFSPNTNLTRAMLVNILYRAENSPETTLSKFSDVNVDAWYANAIGWASENEIVSGISDDEFAPDEYITREQVCAILMRYMNHFNGIEYSECDSSSLINYSDYTQISPYALEAIAYMRNSGIVNGRTDTTLNPKDEITRAETAMILMKLFDLYV